MRAKQTKRKADEKGKTEKPGFFRIVWWTIKFIFTGIWKVLTWTAKKIISLFRSDEKNAVKKEPAISQLQVLETIKGDFMKFWNQFCSSDSTIGIIIGSRGSGKTAFALKLMENMKGQKENIYAMGFPSKKLPKWVKVIEDTKEIKNDSFIVIDEGGILFSSRDSMSGSNKMLSELLLIARHKDLTTVFVSQNSSNIEINTMRQADFLALKKSSLLQSEFERKIISKIYTEYADKFEKYKDDKGATLIYGHEFIGFVENDLPTFWSKDVGKSFK